jgi:ATP-binding cassette subfamily C (CFTR/MRP) protein 1
VITANSTGIISPLATFTVFVISADHTGQTLNTSKAYTAMSLVLLLAEPMNTLLRTIPDLNSALACFDRLQAFLRSDARRDHRLPLLKPVELTERNVSSQDIEMDDFSRRTPGCSSSNMIVAQNASFAWGEDCSPVVSDFSFTLPCGQICFMIGPVGSGKSTLLKGLLGETPSSKGFIYTKSTTTGYVEQTSWIQNGSIQDNVLGVSPFDAPWYDQVVRACALEHDISILPDGSGM